MLTNADITLYHLDQNEQYQKTVFCGVSLHHKTKASPLHNGMIYDNTVTIRIPTREAVLVDADDYILLEKDGEAYPDKARCKKVVGFADNRRGSPGVQHWRIDCK